MRKHIAISLLFIYLFSTTPCSQLLKFPFLIEHYTEHHLENDALSFLTFLKIHYVHLDGQLKDDEKDMKLPFKMNEVLSFFTTTVLPDQSSSHLLVRTFFYAPSNDFGLRKEHFYYSYTFPPFGNHPKLVDLIYTSNTL